jgi:tRNA pseudouridine synthase 9
MCSQPVHATGRYFKHTVLELLKSDHGITAYSKSLPVPFLLSWDRVPLPVSRSWILFEISLFTLLSYYCTGVNRLDRLTSGLMILATTGKASTGLAQEFIKGHVKKEYLARVRGKFPE